MAEARDIYIAKARASTDSNTRWSAYEGQLNKTYPRILEADGVLQRRFEGLTTAMLTRRLSPLDEKGKWLSPWELIEMLHGGGIRKSVRRTLDYHLDDFDFEYVAVTAPTRSAATPHEHIYLWVDDPGDHVSTYHLAPALEKHLKYCPNAYEKHHQFRADGTGGAITVRHEPDFTDNVPEKKEQITEASASTNSGEELPPQTGGAQYLASQLVHLPLADFYDDAKDDPLDTLMEGAAIAWVTSHRWFRASSGVPRLNSKSGE